MSPPPTTEGAIPGIEVDGPPRPKSFRPTCSCCLSLYLRSLSLSFFSSAFFSLRSRSRASSRSRSRSFPFRLLMLLSLAIWKPEDDEELRRRRPLEDATLWCETDRLEGRLA